MDSQKYAVIRTHLQELYPEEFKSDEDVVRFIDEVDDLFKSVEDDGRNEPLSVTVPDECESALEKIREARRQRTESLSVLDGIREARFLEEDTDLVRFTAVLELPYFAFIAVHAESAEQIREWFDCSNEQFPSLIPTMREVMSKLSWKQRHCFGGKSRPKVAHVDEVTQINIPGFYIGQSPSEEAIRDGYENVDQLVNEAIAEEACSQVLRWAVADKKTREVDAVFRTRAEARAARKDGQVVGSTYEFGRLKTIQRLRRKAFSPESSEIADKLFKQRQ